MMFLKTSNTKLAIVFISLFVFVFVMFGCEPPEKLSDMPEIKFKDFIMTDTVDELDNPIKKGELKFSIVDGDGDIGLKESDTTGAYHPDSMYYHNLFIKLYEMIDGEFQEIELKIPHYYRTPFIEEREGQNKSLKAEIKVDFQYSYNFFKHDTIRYSFYIVDRALHLSNTEYTPYILLDEDGRLYNP